MQVILVPEIVDQLMHLFLYEFLHRLLPKAKVSQSFQGEATLFVAGRTVVKCYPCILIVQLRFKILSTFLTDSPSRDNFIASK